MSNVEQGISNDEDELNHGDRAARRGTEEENVECRTRNIE